MLEKEYLKGLIGRNTESRKTRIFVTFLPFFKICFRATENRFSSFELVKWNASRKTCLNFVTRCHCDYDPYSLSINRNFYCLLIRLTLFIIVDMISLFLVPEKKNES